LSLPPSPPLLLLLLLLLLTVAAAGYSFWHTSWHVFVYLGQAYICAELPPAQATAGSGT
jgi:hypothetical protein